MPVNPTAIAISAIIAATVVARGRIGRTQRRQLDKMRNLQDRAVQNRYDLHRLVSQVRALQSELVAERLRDAATMYDA
jgi:hypothetical protein